MSGFEGLEGFRVGTRPVCNGRFVPAALLAAWSTPLHFCHHPFSFFFFARLTFNLLVCKRALVTEFNLVQIPFRKSQHGC